MSMFKNGPEPLTRPAPEYWQARFDTAVEAAVKHARAEVTVEEYDKGVSDTFLTLSELAPAFASMFELCGVLGDDGTERLSIQRKVRRL